MSTVSIRDLTALETAVKELGGIFVSNQKTYRWYGRYMGDTKLPDGIKESDLGKCTHAIRVDGAGYDIGVVLQPDNSYRLLWDYWGPGSGLVQQFGNNGNNLNKLMQSYSRHATKNAAKKAGYFCREKVLPNGNIKLQLIHA
jgi:Protein of unknown function (DUF1257)